MSLYLKMLDDGFDKGEKDLFFFKGHVLPDMTNNVKCGNSLVGSDFFEGQFDFSIEEMKEVKPMDWGNEFSEIFKDGGFDCVIGNPPYFNINTLEKKIFNYLSTRYSNIHTGYNDIMYYFIYKGIKLLNDNGLYMV